MVLSKVKTYGELVMFSHTLFSLPFALIAMVWAASGMPAPDIIFWIIVALVAGRNGANALNRWVDKDIDKKNPRTAHRHLPKGVVKSWEVIVLTAVCFAIFVYAAYKLNPLCFYLSPVALLLFISYSYTKRFTWACHLILGIACAGAPVGAWFAVTGKVELIPFFLGAVVMLWVAGFDIIYGTQDIKFDNANGLFSIPARFGLTNSLMISRTFHGLMIALLVGLGVVMNMGLVYFAGVVISAILLLVEHKIVNPSNKIKMNIASYHINQIVSMLLLTATMIDVFII